MYGIIISLGILISALYCERLSKNKGLNPNSLWSGLFFGLVFGITGARLYHVLDLFSFYSQNPIKIFQIWNGGLGIYGGLFAGVLAFIIYLKTKKENILKWLDIAGVGIPLAQGIGRWGNYFNKELLPYSIYESLFDIILFLVLSYLIKSRKIKSGIIFSSYLIGYGIIRIVLEKTRQGVWNIHGIDVAGFISLILIATGIYLAYAFNKSS